MKYIFGTIALVALVAAILFSFNVIGPNTNSYSGKAVFNTEQEYANFKTALTPQDVYIGNITTLNSTLPIIVTFEVSVPEGSTFPYGTHESNAGRWVAIGFLYLIGIGCTAIAITVDN